MKTEIFDADPFTSRKGQLLLTIESDYRFEKGDEFVIEGDSPQRMRVISVRLFLRGNSVRREVVAMRI